MFTASPYSPLHPSPECLPQAVDRTRDLLDAEGIEVKESLRAFQTILGMDHLLVPVVYKPDSPFAVKPGEPPPYNPCAYVHKALVDALKGLRALDAEFARKWTVLAAMERATKRATKKRSRLGLPVVSWEFTFPAE